MPELPEAEANRRRLAEGALHRTVERVRLGRDTRHFELPRKAERDRFEGRRFTETRRHGKLVFIGSATGPWIAVHLGMTGSLRVWDDDGEAPSHLRIVFEMEGGRRFGFRCPRKLGWVRVTEDVDAFVEAQGLGPEITAIGARDFARRVGSSRGAIKSALLDQKKVAGVGNLWSDEVLFQTGVMPDARADRLPEGRIDEIRRALQRILDRVMDAGADYDRLPDDWLIHARKDGATCPRCGGRLKKKTVGGRSAYHCPDHQEGA